MTLRTTYGYNCQKTTWTRMSAVRPLGYMSVVPGETISGSLSTRTHSAPVLRNILTRTYVDHYMFYMPYRLAWSGWPDFISGVSDVAPATVSNLWTLNFEPRFTRGTLGVPATLNNNFQRRMYNLVCRDFFVRNKADLTGLDATTLIDAFQRPSTFEVATVVKADPATTIDSSGSTIPVDDIRAAFAEDQFSKMRQFYGQRYTDYLMAVGVKVPWTMLDECEKIGGSSANMPFRQVSATIDSAAVDIGYNAGYFSGRATTKIKRTFIPEHGLIGHFAVIRCDPISEDSPQNPELSFTKRDEFWSPEFESQKMMVYIDQIFKTATNLAKTIERPRFQHLRMGMNENMDQTVTGEHDEIMGIAVESELKDKYSGADFAGTFQADTLPSTNQFQHTTDWRLRRNSPVMRPGQMKPLY